VQLETQLGTSLQREPRGVADMAGEQRGGKRKGWMSVEVPDEFPPSGRGNGASPHVSGSWQERGTAAVKGWLPALGLVALIAHMSPCWP